MRVHEFRSLRLIEQHVQQRLAFRGIHIQNFHRHKAIHVNRFAAAVLMSAEHRVNAFVECLHSAIVAALGRTVIVVMQRAFSFQASPYGRVQCFIGGIAAGKQRVSAG